VSDPHQPQDPYATNPFEKQPSPPPAAPSGYGYPPQDPYAQQPQEQQPGYPPQPGYGGYNYGGPVQQSNGIAIASMVVGIVSVVGSCFFGGFIGIVAIGLGIGGLKRSKNIGTGRGQAIAGIATGAAGLLISVVLLIVLLATNSIHVTSFHSTTY
jgi:hypothetical protein